jgi:hypothetical protein
MKRRLDAATFSVLLAGCGGGSSEPKGTDATRADAAPSGGEDAVAGGAPADAASGGTPGDAQGGGSARDANADGDDAALTDATPAPNDGPADDASQSTDAVDVGPPPPPPQDDNGLVINEFMASNKYTLRDAAGSAPDWVELYNGTDHALQLGGYIFSTDPERIDPALAFVLPDELSIEPGAYLVLRFDPEADPAPDRVGLNLEKVGGTIALLRPDGAEVDAVSYFAQTADLSASRTPDGAEVWNILWEVSPGAANPNGRGRPSNGVVPAADDVANRYLFDALPEIRLTVTPANIQALRDQPREHVDADMTFQGRTFNDVGVRLKGQNSFLPIDRKPSLKIKVDHTVNGALFMGLETMTLNNMSGDPTLAHEVMAYWMARSAGLFASRAGHALVYINDVFYGVYSHIETVDKRFLKRWFADATGPLYESWDVDFRPNYINTPCDVVNDPPRNGCYELEAGMDDKTALLGLADALALPAPDAIAAASAFIDFDQFQLFWAVCGTIGQFDSFPYSNPGDDYFTYVEPESQRITFMPWGMDETYPGRPGRNVLGVSSILAQRCIEDPTCSEGYRLALWSTLDLARDLDAAAEMDARVAVIAPYLDMDVRKPYATAQVEAAQRAMRDFIVHRADDVQAMVPRP